MSVNITTEPIEIVIDGVSFLMQGDPTATPEWGTLLETEVTYADKREQQHKDLQDALAALAHSPEDAETVHGLTCGTRTLKLAAEGYVKEVAGFPTQPSSTSTGRSKKT